MQCILGIFDVVLLAFTAVSVLNTQCTPCTLQPITQPQRMLPIALRLRFETLVCFELQWIFSLQVQSAPCLQKQQFNYGKQRLSKIFSYYHYWACKFQINISLDYIVLECLTFNQGAATHACIHKTWEVEEVGSEIQSHVILDYIAN